MKQRQLNSEPPTPPRLVPTSRTRKPPVWLLVSGSSVGTLLLALALYAAYAMGTKSHPPETTSADQRIASGFETDVTNPSPVPQTTEPPRNEVHSPSLPSERTDVSDDVPAAPSDGTSSVPEAEPSAPAAGSSVPEVEPAAPASSARPRREPSVR